MAQKKLADKREEIIGKVKNLFIREDRNRVERSTYNTRYKSLVGPSNQEVANYLKLNLPIAYKRTLAQLRLAGRREWRIRSNDGMLQKIKEEELCKMCNKEELKEIEHIIIKCPTHEECRTKAFESIHTTQIIATGV